MKEVKRFLNMDLKHIYIVLITSIVLLLSSHAFPQRYDYDLTVKRGDYKELVFKHKGDVTAKILSFVVKLTKDQSSNRLVFKRNTIAGGDTNQISASYTSPNTTITVKILSSDTWDLNAKLYYYDLVSIEPTDSNKEVTLFDGKFNIPWEVQGPFDGTDLPDNATRITTVSLANATSLYSTIVWDTTGKYYYPISLNDFKNLLNISGTGTNNPDSLDDKPASAYLLKVDTTLFATPWDLASLPIPDQLADLNEDATHRTVTDTEKSTWNAKQDAMGSDDNYVTDAEKTVIGNTSGTNTGDNATNSLYSGLASSKLNVSDAQLFIDTVYRSNDTIYFKQKDGTSLFFVDQNLGGGGDTLDVDIDSLNVLLGLVPTALQPNSTINPANITQSTSYRLVTDTEKSIWNAKQDAMGSDDNYVTDAEKTVIGNTSGTNTGDNATNTQYSGLAASKQDALVSGTNIKTINSQSILGSGNIVIDEAAGGDTSTYTLTQIDSLLALVGTALQIDDTTSTLATQYDLTQLETGGADYDSVQSLIDLAIDEVNNTGDARVPFMWAYLQLDTTGSVSNIVDKDEAEVSTLETSAIFGVSANSVVRVAVDSARFKLKYDLGGTPTWTDWLTSSGYYKDVDSAQVQHYSSSSNSTTTLQRFYVSNDVDTFSITTVAGGGGGGSYTTEATRYFVDAGALADSQKTNIDNLVLALQDSLAIDSLPQIFDAIYLFANETETAAKLNLVKRQDDAIEVYSSVVFTAWEGFRGVESADPDTSGYMNTTYNASSDGVNFTQNSASFGFYATLGGDTTLSGHRVISFRDVTEPNIGTIHYATYNSPHRGLTRLNDDTWFEPSYGEGTNVSGLHVVSRTGASVISRYKSNNTNLTILKDDGTTTSTVVPDGEVRLFREYRDTGLVIAGSPCLHELAIVFFAEGLTETQVRQIRNCFREYLLGIGTNIE